MKYIRDIDYFLYFVDFPHMGVPGIIAANTDGTVNIYINTLYTPERQDRALRHELRHLARQHFWCDTKTIEEIELEADTEDPSVVFGEDFMSVEIIEEEKPSRLPDVLFDAPEGKIPLFQSLDIFKAYLVAMGKQYRSQNGGTPQ